MKNITDRQQTGIWFAVVGVLLLSFWFLSFSIVNWAIGTGYLSLPEANFTDEQLYVIGGASVASVQFASLLGIPFIFVGLAQVATGFKKSKKNNIK